LSSNSNHPYQSNINAIRKVYTATVTAGSNYSDQPLIQAKGKIVYATFLFTTDANAANRLVQFGVENAGTFFPLGSAKLYQTANITMRYFCFPGAPVEITGGDLIRYIPLPDTYSYYREDFIQTAITNIQVGDQLTACYVWSEYQPSPKYV